MNVFGGITGALDPDSKKANAHAKIFYEFIRRTDSDIAHISKNLGINTTIIEQVKRYIFIDQHELSYGYENFAPSYEMAESWRRLAFEPNNIQKHDITLIYHEAYELSLVAEGDDQAKAHKLASQVYNYQNESNQFYEKLRKQHRLRAPDLIKSKRHRKY